MKIGMLLIELKNYKKGVTSRFGKRYFVKFSQKIEKLKH